MAFLYYFIIFMYLLLKNYIGMEELGNNNMIKLVSQ